MATSQPSHFLVTAMHFALLWGVAWTFGARQWHSLVIHFQTKAQGYIKQVVGGRLLLPVNEHSGGSQGHCEQT